ncbi:EpsG family protein [Oceanobacillus sp. CF4.6]|uniref:EpsG family protein n=1 Tax=Oceanobacillus sp. CF4.6 TaxID=3373080 RepID=UPI003EE4E9B7
MFGILGDYIIIIVLFFMFLILSLTEEKFSLPFKKVIIYISILFISLFASVRSIGMDTNSYIAIFEQHIVTTFNIDFLKNLFQHSLEPGFNLMISYLKLFGFTYKSFFFLSALIPLLIISKIIFNIEKKHVFLTFFLFLLMHVLYGPLDVIRQFFAATIFISALFSLSRGKKIVYFLKIFISIFFHYSSIVFFVITPLLKLKWNMSRYVCIGVLTSLMGFLLKNYIVDYILLLEMDTANRFFLKLQGYIDSAYNPTTFIDSLTLNSMLYLPKLFNVIIIIILLIYYRHILRSEFNRLLLNAQILSSLIFTFFYFLGAETIALRLELLLGIGSFILLKEMLVFTKKDKIYKFMLMLLYFVIYTISIIIYMLKLRTNIL